MPGSAIVRRIRARVRALLARLGYDGYEPARHYMRGPGPRSLAKQGNAARERDRPVAAPSPDAKVKDAGGARPVRDR